MLGVAHTTTWFEGSCGKINENAIKTNKNERKIAKVIVIIANGFHVATVVVLVELQLYMCVHIHI